MADIFYVFRGLPTSYQAFGRQVRERSQLLGERSGEIVALWEDNNPDFVINLFALWACGAVPLLVSRRLPWTSVTALLDTAGARAVIVPEPGRCAPAPIPVITSACRRDTEEAQGATSLPEIGSACETAVILHTSGTTGFPKLVPITRSNLMATLEFEATRWRGLWTEQDAHAGWLPLYHSFGLISELLHAYRTGSRYYFADPTPRALVELFGRAPITGFSSVPWMLAQILELPGGAEALSRLRHVVVGGAVLDEGLGLKLDGAGVRLVQQYGMTELGAVLRGTPGGDWRDMSPVIPQSFWHLDPQTGELAIHGDCPTMNASSPNDVFLTRDAFERTPAGTYRYQARLDDLVVHASGEKSDAPAIERKLMGRVPSTVGRIVIVGAGRLRLACLVHWKEFPTETDMASFRQALRETNPELPAHSQLQEERLLHLSPAEGERIPLNLKGTVIRRSVEQVFRAELSELYETHQKLAASEDATSLRSRLSALPARDRRAELRRIVARITGEVRGNGQSDPIDSARGFADQGIDSLGALQIKARLQSEFGIPFAATLLFDFPTIDRLAERIADDLAAGPAAVSLRSAVGEPDDGNAIAIVGAACRLPGDVNHLDDYWQLLVDQRVVVSEVPPERWNAAAWYDPNPDAAGKTYVTRGGFLRDAEGFDAAFFHISPRELKSLDPQQRLLLETAWEALEQAGENPEGLRGSRTGVFVGISAGDPGEKPDCGDPAAAYQVTGGASSVAAGRISFFLGLHGPSLAVDTACSSSLVAVHLACQALRAGDCDRAIVGAVNLLSSPHGFVALSRLRALSSDGRCKPFAANADGFGRAEGCVAIILKRRADAERDGDRILALVRGSAVNHGGASSGLTVPNGPAQEALMRDALSRAGVTPGDVDFVECHGSGTPLGDPIEVQALSAVYGRDRSPWHPLRLGGVKANLGHLEAGAGLAGLLKTILCFEHEEIAPQPPLGELTPHVPWSGMALKVATEPHPWPRGVRPRLAGVSAFGLSGTCAHLILEEPPPADRHAPHPGRAAELIVLSAKTPAALNETARRLHDQLEKDPRIALPDLALSLATGRAHLPHRLALSVSSSADAKTALAEAARGETPKGGARGRASGSDGSKVAFVFPGQGSQWLGMGRQLLEEASVFRSAMERCDEAIRAKAGWSVIAELLADDATSRLAEIDIVQPVLFAMEVALAALWRSVGVEPDLVIGHSLGEVAAAHTTGALSLADAASIIVRRSRLLRRIIGQGEMAMIELPLSEAEAELTAYKNRLGVAVVNSPRATVVAGEPEALSAFLAGLKERGTFGRRIKVDVASHCAQVDPLLPELAAALSGIAPRTGTIPMLSTVDGRRLSGPELDAAYWTENLRRPVHFQAAVEDALLSGEDVKFIEMSPHPLLIQSIIETGQAQNRAVVASGSLKRDQPEWLTFLAALGAVHVHGAPLAWSALFAEAGRRVALPTYPWERARIGPAAEGDEPAGATGEPANFIRTQIAAVLGMAASTLDASSSLSDLGMDSLSAVDLRNRLSPIAPSLKIRTILESRTVGAFITLLAPDGDKARASRSLPPVRVEPPSWIAVPRPVPKPAARLLCFPYAGAGPAAFAGWAERLAGTVEFGVVHLPGRGTRLKETPFRRMADLADALLPSLLAYCDGPPVIFLGHSLGALILFEAAHRLRNRGSGPAHLFVSGGRAPHYYTAAQHRMDSLQYSPHPGLPAHEVPDAELLEMTRDLGFSSSRALERDDEVRRLMLPALRADLEINNTYLFEPGKPLDIPITAIGGRVDPFVNAPQLLGWGHHTTAGFSAVFRPGGHYFIDNDQSFCCGLVERTLAGLRCEA